MESVANIFYTEERPWGNFTILEESKGFKIKKIEIKPQQRLSLQFHKHRSEHWVVVSGKGLVTKDKETILLEKGEHISIPKECVHRMTNNNDEKVVFIEIQNGDYLGEDDIIRLEDDYKRI
ncbi:MAG: phosphomannose isomerase type II C-terminal cupin domain [Candidatus Gastranaerophilales bacterium]|nr:phosphomannose isomerase type II C-terminal cupin domain [Candidatus Gastranaerophilales bacterium]